MVIIVLGLPGSGKSYFAIRVAQMLHAKYISSDEVRKEMFEIPHYSTERNTMVYDEMLRRTIEAIKHGKEIVLDATFYSNELRQKFIGETKNISGIYLIEMYAEDELIKQRLLLPRRKRCGL